MELSLSNIVKTFADKVALNGITLSAHSGQALGLLGRNGAGKTTTIRIIMRVFPADSGTVHFADVPSGGHYPLIGYLPEERGLYPKQQILSQMIYLAQLRGLGRAQAKSNSLKWLERLEMGEYALKKLETLSKGNQQKIQLAVTMVADPEVIILDEPFSGLDPVNAQMLKGIVRDQVKEGKLVIFSSHQMSYVEEFCNDIVILKDGKVAISGELEAIKHSYPRDTLRICGNFGVEALKVALGGVARDIRADGHDLMVTLVDAALKHDALQRLADAGLDVDRFEVAEPTLEQIFVEKAGDGK